jgi:IS5 family transposase
MKAYKTHSSANLFSVGFAGSEKRLLTIQKTYLYLASALNIPQAVLRQSSSIGQRQYDPVLLFKILFLQYLFALSDRDVIEMVKDSLSFREFVGIGRPEEIPEKTVLVRFRAELSKHGFGDSLFVASVAQLKQAGIVIKGGAIIDSSIIEAKGKKSKSEKRKDKDAKHFKKNNHVFFGYKLHALVDSNTQAILQQTVTPANTHDSVPLEKLAKKECPKSLYGDKAYAGNVAETILKANGIKPRILRKSYRGRKLSELDEKRNTVLSKVRAKVEHVFARMKNEFDLVKVPYFTLEKNTFFLGFLCAIYNAKVMWAYTVP